MGTDADLTVWWQTIVDVEQGNAAKAQFQTTMQSLDDGLNTLKTAYDAGDYNQLPASVRTKFVWAWSQLNTVRNTLKADAEFMAALNWRP